MILMSDREMDRQMRERERGGERRETKETNIQRSSETQSARERAVENKAGNLLLIHTFVTNTRNVYYDNMLHKGNTLFMKQQL